MEARSARPAGLVRFGQLDSAVRRQRSGAVRTRTRLYYPGPAAGSSGTPVTEGTPGRPAHAAGSAGTPATASVPTTTVVPVPHGPAA